MSSTTAFRIGARLSLVTTVLLFGLIVLGSVVRTTGSGLACPDWPLCHGRLIPPFQFNVLIEWFHRLFALLTSVALFATVGWVMIHPATRSRVGALAVLAVALLFVQILLGALTVWKLLDPNVVSGHLAVGLLLFATLLTLGLSARQAARDGARPGPRRAGLLPLFAVATAAIWVQAVLGGMVSTNHASLACPDWPTCNGRWLPEFTGLVGLQMAHRFGAYLLIALLAWVAVRAGSAPDVTTRNLGRVMFLLVLAQGAIGVANVLLGIPVWVSALHLGTAALLLALSLVGTFRLAAMPAGERAGKTAAPAVQRAVAR